MRHKIVSRALRMALLSLALVAAGPGIAQTKLYVVNAGEDTVSVIDADTGKVIDTIKGPGHLTAITYNPADGFLYLPTQEAKGEVHIIDPATNSFVGRPLAVGAFPGYMTISPEIDRGYVSNQFGGLSAVDMTTRKVITEIAGVESPIGSAFSPARARYTSSALKPATFPLSTPRLMPAAYGCDWLFQPAGREDRCLFAQGIRNQRHLPGNCRTGHYQRFGLCHCETPRITAAPAAIHCGRLCSTPRLCEFDLGPRRKGIDRGSRNPEYHRQQHHR